MKSLIIRAIGRPQETWQKEAIHMYVERLNRFGGIEITELPEGHGKSAKPDEQRAKKSESSALLKGIPEHTFVVALDSRGKAYDSKKLSKNIEEWEQKGRLVFLIGGSWGIDQETLNRADTILSFGPMTLPHGLARIVLLEQNQLFRTQSFRA